MPDLRPGRKSNRQAEVSAYEHGAPAAKKPKADPIDALELALGLTVGKASPGAFKGATLNARKQIRVAVATAGALMMQLDAAFQSYAEACDAALEAKGPRRKTLAAVAEGKRQQLAELRRTINALAPLNAQLLKAGKLVHDGDFDRLLRQVQITGTSHFDRLCEGE